MALKLSPFRFLLLAGASAVAVSTAAHAAPRILFASGSGVAQGPIAPGQPVTSQGGVTQVQLDSGAVVSFVGPTTFSVGADGALEIQRGNITLGGGTGPTLIRLPGGGSLNASAGTAASFAVSTTGTLAGQVMTGSATLASGGTSQTFTSAQFFRAQPGGAPTQTFAGLAPQATPSIVGATGINIGGYNPILNAAIQQNPALSTLPLGQSQTQLANYLVALGQTIGQLFTPAQLLQLAAQYGPQTPTPTTPTPTPTTPTPTPTTPTPTPTTPTPTPTTPTPTPTTPTPTPTTPTPTPTTPTPTPTTPTPTPTTPTPTPTTPTPTPTTPTPTPTTPTPTPTTPTPTPTTPTPTPTTPTPTPTTPTPTPTTPTPTPTTGVDSVSPPAGSSSMLVAKATLTENAGYESDKATLVIGAGSFDGYDINNGLTQFRRLGTQFSAEYYADKGVIGIARWAGGSGVLGSERGPTQGDHFVFGSKATNIPAAGLFTFDLLAYTQPTIRNQATASTGSVSGRASVGYFSGRASNAGLDFTVLVNSSTYVVRSPGGLSAPSLTLGSNGVLSGNPFRITSGTGPACSGATCEVAYGGFLAGNAGSDLGLVYTIYNPSVSTTTGRVDGAVLFGNPTTPTQTAAAQFNQSFMSRTTPAAGTEGAPLGSRGVAISATGDVYDIASITRFLGSGTTFPDQFNADNGSGGTYAVSAGSVSGLDQGGYIGRLGWVRWNGTAVVNGVTSSLTNIPIVWLTPLTGTAPTGRASYELMGTTAPTIGAAQNGGTLKGALVVDFATSLVGWDTVLDMSGERLNFYSAGRLATPSVTLAGLSNGQRRFSGSGVVAAESLACGGCSGTMTGLIGGPDASEAGVTYVVNSYFGPITGAAAFRREGGLGRITGAPVGGPVQGGYTTGNVISAGAYTNTQISVTADGQARGLGDASRGTSSGAAKNIEFGGDGGQIGWTRWYDGTAMVNSINRAYGVNNGVHLIWGAPVTNMPTTGVANYTLVGATKPTLDTFNTATAPGEFAGTFAVDFASLKAGLSSTVTMGPTVYNLSSSGGSAAPSMAVDATSGTFAVSTTVNGQFGSIYGFLAGPGASHAGVTYRFQTAASGPYIGGVAAFKK